MPSQHGELNGAHNIAPGYGCPATLTQQHSHARSAPVPQEYARVLAATRQPPPPPEEDAAEEEGIDAELEGYARQHVRFGL